MVETNRAANDAPKIAYILPFVLVLIFTIVSIKNPSTPASSNAAPLSNPVRQATLGFAYLLAFVLLVRKPWLIAIPARRNLLYIAYITYLYMSSFWSSYPYIVIISFIHNIGFTLVIFCAVFYIENDINRLLFILSAIFFLLISFSIAISLMYPSLGVYNNIRWMGILNHPNTLGYVCMLSIWTSFTCIYTSQSKMIRFISISILIESTICIYFTYSITSLICSIFIILSLLFLMYIHFDNQKHLITPLFFYGWCWITLLCLIYVFSPHLFISTLHLIGRSSDLSGRTDLWKIGENVIMQRPFGGWSFDSMTSITSQNIIAYDQFHNGYINLAVSGGFLGLGLFFLILLKYVRSSLGLLRTQYAITVSLSVLVIAILIHNISEASIMRVTHPLWLLFVFSYFYIDYLSWSVSK